MAFRCALCSSKGTVKLLAEHYPSRHPGERIKISELIHNRVQCVLCPRQFSSKTALNSHFLSAHPGEAVSSQKVNAQDISDDLDRWYVLLDVRIISQSFCVCHQVCPMQLECVLQQYGNCICKAKLILLQHGLPILHGTS